MITFHNLSKSIGEDCLFKNVNLSIPKGKITTLVGESGIGKTSLLRCLSLIDIPDQGGMTFNNYTCKFPCTNIAEYYSRSVVFQQLFLWPHLNNRKNIFLSLKKSEYDFAKIICKKLNISHLLEKYPNECSVGQKQKIAIARSISMNPEYIFLDEPTSALDRKNIDLFISLLNELKKHNKGIFLISHDPYVTDTISDSIIEMSSLTA